MNGKNNRRTEYILWGILVVPILWFAAMLAQATTDGSGLAEIAACLSALMAAPTAVRWCANTLKFMVIAVVLYVMILFYYYADQADRHPGAEYGTAKWGSIGGLNRKYRDTKHQMENYIFTQHIQMGMDVFRHRHNLNVVIIGGSGAGKTRFYAKPNLMQCACSYFCLDPKGELLRDMGGLFEKMGITVTVIDLVHFKGHYNPMAYIQTDEDAIKLAFAIVNNTKPKDAPASGDKFWDDASVMLISAIILYLMYEAPKEEQNFSTLMYMILNCQLSEENQGPNPLELLFQELEEHDPNHPAVLQFHSFMLGSTKTLQSVLITAAANLYMDNSKALLLMRSEDPVVDDKYDITKHPNVRFTPDGEGLPFIMPYDYMGEVGTIPAEELKTLKPDDVPAEVKDRFELIETEDFYNDEDFYEEEKREDPQNSADGEAAQNQAHLSDDGNHGGDMHGDGNAYLRGGPADDHQ